MGKAFNLQFGAAQANVVSSIIGGTKPVADQDMGNGRRSMIVYLEDGQAEKLSRSGVIEIERAPVYATRLAIGD